VNNLPLSILVSETINHKEKKNSYYSSHHIFIADERFLWIKHGYCSGRFYSKMVILFSSCINFQLVGCSNWNRNNFNYNILTVRIIVMFSNRLISCHKLKKKLNRLYCSTLFFKITMPLYSSFIK
jgi:hypothetical protein